jgi:para-nitrobenzyl esterase
VTLFGESAGGGSVLTMMTSPLSKGLFQKAIIESGGGRGLFPTRYLSKSLPNRPSAEEIGVAFAKKAGITGEGKDALAALRALPADKVVDGLNMASMNSPTYAGPMIDGKLLVEEPEAAFLAGRQAKIPLIAGANSSDIGFSSAKSKEELFAPFGADRSSAEKAYDEVAKAEFAALRSAVAADRMMVEPARFVVQTQRAAGLPAFEYRFSYVAECMRKQWKGAPHATEIPFVFDTVKDKYGSELTPADEAIARAANAYWAGFAKTGTPTAASLPEWPAYDAQADVLMNFTNSGPKVERDPWHDRMEIIRHAAEASNSK